MKKVFKTAAFLLAMGLMTSTFTSCGEEDENTTDEEVAEQFKFNGLTAIANSDGTITIGGHIETNTKLKEFCLYKADGSTPAYDFLNENEQVKNKNQELDDNGKTVKNKSFTLDIESKTLPVDKYVLAIKTKKNGKADAKIGEDYSFELGYGSKSTLGSYVSVVNSKSYTQAEVEADATIAGAVEFVLSDNGLKPASQAKNAQEGKVNYGKYAKSAIYANTIITSTGCIATYTLKENAGGENGTMSGIIMKSKEGVLAIKAAKESDLSK